ncbi:MAG: phosphoribosylanthranilate isomerase [Lachnospiraceae bacterium]|nr:phosphoribosylanthranilate isomerase [Lachnospiraceae bacterium]
MTKIKLCGITRAEDIEIINRLKPDYIGFVFWAKSKRNIGKLKAAELKKLLIPEVKTVGVFVDEVVNTVAELLNEGIIDTAQLHGSEDDDYIGRLRSLTENHTAASFCRSDEPAEITELQEDKSIRIIKAFKIRNETDLKAAEESSADMILLDAGMGEGKKFEWSLLKDFKRSYFLAGGLDTGNAAEAVKELHPYGVDVSSGIERDGVKDSELMELFAHNVRKADGFV